VNAQGAAQGENLVSSRVLPLLTLPSELQKPAENEAREAALRMKELSGTISNSGADTESLRLRSAAAV
jgi:hypothetical protein